MIRGIEIEQGVRQRLDRASERRRLGINDGPAEHRVVGIRHGRARQRDEDRPDDETR